MLVGGGSFVMHWTALRATVTLVTFSLLPSADISFFISDDISCAILVTFGYSFFQPISLIFKIHRHQ